MIGNKKVLAVIPARGGSKGIKLKNIKKIGNKSLINIVANVIKETPLIDVAICSTDHKEIAAEAKKFGLSVPFIRPEHLSGDFIGDIDVLKHALLFCEKKYKYQFDIVLMLQPTSPFRKSKHIIDAIDLFINKKADSVWSLSLTDGKSHPDKQLKISENQINYNTDNGEKIVYRQQLSKLYHKNGVVYVISRDCIINNTIKGQNCYPYVIDEFMPNIDTELDLRFANFLINKT